MDKNTQENKKRILLHSCCGPCSTTAIFTLGENYQITICYYNPNIYPTEEYLKRKGEQIKLINKINEEGKLKVEILDVDYESEKFFDFVKGYEKEKEGGARCERCFLLRLDKVASLAKEKGFDLFATTLTVSPHKNAPLINQIGEQISRKYSIEYLPTDFKKKDGYKKSIEYSKQYDLYRQNYCGCKYSMWFK